MRARSLLGATVAAVLLLAACDSMYVASQEESGAHLTLLSLSQGGFLQSDSPIQFRVDAPAGLEDDLALTVYLEDSTGTSVWEASVPAPPTNEIIELAPLDPLKLETGRYTLRFVLTSAAREEQVEEVSFYFVHGPYTIEGIRSFPPVGRTSGSTLLAADVSVPTGANPYLVWAVGDLVFAQAYLADGGNQVLWKAPQHAGIYSVTLSLFPVDPGLTGQLAVVSPAAMSAALYVVDRASAVADLDAYYALLLLDGDLVDTAVEVEVDAPLVQGGLIAMPIGDDLGIAINPQMSVEFQRLLIPADAAGFAPFTLLVDVARSETDEGGAILAFRHSATDGSLSLGVTAEGLLWVTASTGDSTAELLADRAPIAVGEPVRVALSLAPGTANSGRSDAALYVDGQQVAAGRDILPAGFSGGFTVFGGDESFAGVVGQVSAYYQNPKPAQDGVSGASLYPYFLQEHLGAHTHQALFAYGMDGLTLPPELAVTGSPVTRAGQLVLAPGTSVTLPEVRVAEAPRLAMLIESLPAGLLSAEVATMGGTATLTLNLAPGTATEGAQLIEASPGTLEVTIGTDGDGLALRVSSADTSVRLPLDEGTQAVRVVLRTSSGTGMPAVVDSLVALRTP